MEYLSSLWNQQTSFTWWQALLIATLALFINGVCCVVNWYLRKETILECGYRKARIRRAKKAMKEWTLTDKILLRRLAVEATETNPMIKLSLFLNYLNVLCGGVLVTGYICSVVTSGTGWALTLCFCPGVFSIFFSTILTFIPDLLWVPSERRRYGIKDKK